MVVVLLDSSFLIYRAWHGYKAEKFKAPDGRHTNAVYGFVNSIKQMYNIFGVKADEVKFIACFDSSSKNHKRSEINPDYKSGRTLPDGLGHQFDICKDICSSLNIPMLIHDEYEADDIIATLAKRYEEIEPVIIVTCDKDMYQLINDNVSIYNIIKKSYVRKEEVISKFGVKPSDMIKFQAIIGDKIDCIKGIKGIGPKSAKIIIEAFEKPKEELNKKEIKLLQKFEDNKDIFTKNISLVTLHTDIEITADPIPFYMKCLKEDTYRALVEPLGFRV